METLPNPEGGDKAAWRRTMRQRRRAVAPAARETAGRQLAERLLAWPLLPREGWVATFLSLPEEIPTAAINTALWHAGRRLAVPAWSRRDRGYRLADWRLDEPVAAGPMRVPQPLEPRWVPPDAVSLFLVPGLVFDRAGGRIGYGGGHYDRLLAGRSPAARCVALGYEWQVVPAVPQAPGDVRVAWILTPAGVIETGVG